MLPTCVNCRASVPIGRPTCPRCGRWAAGTPNASRDDLAPRDEGWGLPSYVLQSASFRWTSLLAPVWVPPLIMAWLGAPPMAVAAILALFIFIPGLYVITNLPRWSPWAKVVASLAYVALSGPLGMACLMWAGSLLHPA